MVTGEVIKSEYKLFYCLQLNPHYFNTLSERSSLGKYIHIFTKRNIIILLYVYSQSQRRSCINAQGPAINQAYSAAVVLIY